MAARRRFYVLLSLATERKYAVQTRNVYRLTAVITVHCHHGAVLRRTQNRWTWSGARGPLGIPPWSIREGREGEGGGDNEGKEPNPAPPRPPVMLTWQPVGWLVDRFSQAVAAATAAVPDDAQTLPLSIHL